jgi:hypothetical protein
LANANTNTKGARFLFCVIVVSAVQDEEVVEWSEAKHSRLAHPAEALVHAPMTTDRKTRRDLSPLCYHRTGPRGRAIILHTMTILRQ